jgi:transcriptional regulator with GAF, ATPase, and Fis domain
MDKVMNSPEPVLIQGESGTGKELVARALHFYSERKNRVFLAENCAAITNSLLESELFGHTKGAFTGANKHKRGLFELAQGGTIFLDEIGDISPELQKKLLRVLQEGEFRRVGGENIVKLKDTRIITATNKNLRELVKSGKFRGDLFYRLNVISINIPPLRERREDIPLLVKYFLSYLAGETTADKIEVTDEAMKSMVKYDWPGNVRELENEIKKAILLDNRRISLDTLSDNLRLSVRDVISLDNIRGRNLREMVDKVVREVESKVILNKLNQARWNKSQVAKELGLSREGLRLKIMKYELDRRR